MKNKYFKNIEIDDDLMYINVKNKTILIKAEEEGIVVDIFQKPKKKDFLGEPITSTWCLYSEK